MTRIAVPVLMAFLFLYILPLNVRPLLMPDEMRYAEIGREMVETGDLIVPRLNGLRYFEKPILGHWLHALSIWLLGENRFAIRLPSALAVGISALMLFFLVRRFTGETSVAIAGTFVFLTCIEVYAVGTFCVLDSIFSMLITGSMIAFFFGFMETHPIRRTVFLICSGIAVGLAFLTKGFLAFLLPVITIVPVGIWHRRLKEAACRFMVVVVAAIFTALPWCIMVHLREPDFWHYFFWVEHVDRFLSPTLDQHPNPFWYFIPIILLGTLPWTTQILAVIFRLRKVAWEDSLLRYAACWFLFPFLFFSACRGKLGTYVLPCFPPLTVLFAIGLHGEFTTATVGRFRRSQKAGLLLIGLVIVVLVLTQTLMPNMRLYRQNETWKWLLLIAGLLVYAGLLVPADRATTQTRRFTFACSAPLLLMLSGQIAVPSQLIEDKAPTEFLERYRGRIGQDTVLVSDNYLASAVCWCYGRTDVSVLGRAGELAYGLEYDDSKHRQLDTGQFTELIKRCSRNKHCVLLTSRRRYAQYKQLLPEPVCENIDGGFVFAEFALPVPATAESTLSRTCEVQLKPGDL